MSGGHGNSQTATADGVEKPTSDRMVDLLDD